jgi:hypothetical protein
VNPTLRRNVNSLASVAATHSPGNIMKLKIAGLALLLAVASNSGFAQTITRNFVQSFKYADVGEVANLGFGRAGDVATVPDGLVAGTDRFGAESSLARGVGETDSFTIGVLPFTFHDYWQFGGLKAGTYSLDSTLTATGSTAFGLVLFEWVSNAAPSYIDFTISNGGKTAHGSGSFTVDASCAATHCVVMHVYGWDDGSASTGYNGKGVATAVPEPTTGALLLAGIGTLGWLARRRRAV